MNLTMTFTEYLTWGLPYLIGFTVGGYLVLELLDWIVKLFKK